MGRNAILVVVVQLVARDLRNNTGGNLADWAGPVDGVTGQAEGGPGVHGQGGGGCDGQLEGQVPPVAAHGQASGSLQCRLDRGEVATGAHRFIGPKLNQMLNSPQAAAPVVHIIFPMVLCMSRLNNYVAL